MPATAQLYHKARESRPRVRLKEGLMTLDPDPLS